MSLYNHAYQLTRHLRCTGSRKESLGRFSSTISSLLLFCWEEAKVHPELLKEHKSKDGLGPESHEGRDVTLERRSVTLEFRCCYLVEGHGALSERGLEHGSRVGILAYKILRITALRKGYCGL